ncbi:MAG: hypothetical protein JWN04_2615 [Myxococcaceae bacterium]|nr:hypothetical protein [Myxococcaceae bacterium]
MGSKAAISVGIFVTAACAPRLSSAAQTIRAADQQMVVGCTLLGYVHGTSGFGGPGGSSIGMERSMGQALNKAAELGATHIIWNSVSGGYSSSAHGMAYACRPGMAASPLPASESQRPYSPTNTRNDEAGAGATPASTVARASASMPPLSEIETVTLHMKETWGFGMTMSIVSIPVVLFKDGTACTDQRILVSDIAEHRARFPRSWITWRRSGGGSAQLSNGWHVGPVYAPQPRGQRFNVELTATSGASNTATGGSVSAYSEKHLRFFPDGRFVQGGSSSLSASSAALRSASADQQGSYEFDGYRLALRYDNGEVMFRSFIGDAQSAWIDGTGYLGGH